MYKVRKQWEGVEILFKNQRFTLYNVLPQQDLEKYYKLLGSRFIYIKKDDSNK